MQYGKSNDDFETYKKIENKLNKPKILKYIKSLPIAAVAPMTANDIFTGQPLEQAGIIEDGMFTFPTDFIYYYENYDIGIPIEYEKYIETKIV
jgi:hypothetical protein